MRDALARLVGWNSVHGFASTIEFIPGTGVADLPSAADVTCGVPDFTILFDMWHFARSHGGIEDIDALPPGAVGGVQLNDWLPPEPGAPYVPMTGRLIPGDGCLPLADILTRIEANSSGLDVGIEVFNADLERMDHDKAAQTLARKSLPYLATAMS
jgi:sugar phosphate isomerase/epimerase